MRCLFPLLLVLLALPRGSRAQCPVTRVAEEVGITNAAAALGVANGVGAELYDLPDRLTVELPVALPASSAVKLALRRKTSYGDAGSAQILVYAAALDIAASYVLADEVNLVQSSGFTVVTVLVPVATRFIRLQQKDGSGDDFEVDAVWADCITTPTTPSTCLNANGSFQAGFANWQRSSTSRTQLENASLVFTGVADAYTSAPVSGGEVYDVAAFAQSNDGRVRVELIWRNGSGATLQTDAVATMEPRIGSVYKWTARAPVGATELRVQFVNLDATRARVDEVCVEHAPTGIPPISGCLNPLPVPNGSTWTHWGTDKSSEVKYEPDTDDDADVERPSIEIQKEYVKVWTEFSAKANTLYAFDLDLLGEDASDKRTFVWVEWLTLAGLKVAETTVLDGERVPKRWTNYQRQVTAPNNPLIVRARLVFQTRTNGKSWIARACVTEMGLAGSAAQISGGVFEDRNKNGRWDSNSGGDPWIEGVLMVLFRDNGDGVQQPELDEEIDRQHTNASGRYAFNGLAAGQYFVLAFLPPTRQVAPTNAFGPTADDVDNDFYLRTWRSTSVAWTDLIALDGSVHAGDVELGITKSGLAAVVGYLWADNDGDTYRNEGPNHGLNGITVRSVGTIGTLTTVTTDGPDGQPGYYTFNYVQPQQARIVITLPSGVTLRPKTGDNTFNPDGRTDLLTLSPDNTIWNRSGALVVSGAEICNNGVDDDLDGKIDNFDSDCSVCTVPEAVFCGQDFLYYLPPLWMGGEPKERYRTPAYLRITSVSSAATVRIRTRDNSYDRTFTAGAAAPLNVLLPESALAATSRHNTVESDKGFIISASAPIEAVYYLDATHNKEIVTLKGYHALGNLFTAGSQVGQYTGTGPSPIYTTCPADGSTVPDTLIREAHFVSAMATEDGTDVTFTWNPARFTPAGGITSPHTVRLNRGQTYLIRDAYTNQTVSGVRVKSTKAIAVVAGSQHTPVCDHYGRDAGIDQLIPHCYLGREYALVKHSGFSKQHYAVVVAVEDATVVRANGSATVLATLNAGDWYRYMVTGATGDASVLQLNKAAYVYQFSGIATTNNEVGMAVAAPIDQCSGNRYLKFLKGPSGDQLLSVTLRTTAAASLRLNGALVAGLAGVTQRTATGRPQYTAFTIPGARLLETNTLTADDYYQAALLIGITDDSGLFGYLTAFAPTIETLRPAGDQPVPRYTLPTLCAGDAITHTLKSTSCNGAVRIVTISNNTSLGTVTQTGPLSFTYGASPTGGGTEVISLRLRDDNGVESSVCVSVTICGPSIAIAGLPASATLRCGQAIATGNPVIVGNTCPMSTPITYTDSLVSGSCAREYKVVRTWQSTAECGFIVKRSREFLFVDDDAPVFSAIPADVIVECGSAPPAAAPLTASDACDGTVAVAFQESTCGNGASPAYYALGATTVYLAEVTDDPGFTYAAPFAAPILTAFDTWDPNVELRWRVRNPNAYPLYFRYEGYGTEAVVGHYVVPANTDLYFFTPRISGALNVHYYDATGTWRSAPKAASYAQSTLAPAATCGCTTVRTWTATDACGNVRKVAQRVHYVDRTAPTLTSIPADRSICATAALPTDLPTVADACGAPALTQSSSTAAGPGFDQTVTRVFTATDACGNTATASQRVTVLAAPAATGSVQDATCGAANGQITLAFADHSARTTIQFALNGAWAAAVNDDTGTYAFSGLAAGTYTVSARWGSGSACPVTLGTFTVAAHVATLGATQVFDLATGSATAITLADGGTYHLGTFPASWNLRTGVTGPQASVRQTVSGAATGTAAGNAPASSFPAAATPTAWGIGTYTLQLQAFAKTGATGPVCATQSMTFRVIANEDCANGLDDDGDGFVDCADEDCPKPAVVTRVSN